MKKLLIVGNWKMHLNTSQASLLVHRLQDKIRIHRNIEVVLCAYMEIVKAHTDDYSVAWQRCQQFRSQKHAISGDPHQQLTLTGVLHKACKFRMQCRLAASDRDCPDSHLGKFIKEPVEF